MNPVIATHVFSLHKNYERGELKYIMIVTANKTVQTTDQ